MALTREDLQAIGALFEAERVHTERMMDSKLSAALGPVTAEIAELRSDMNELRSDVNELRSDVSELRSDMNELRSDMNELRSDMDELSGSVKTDMDKLRESVEVVRASQLIFEVEHLPRIQIALDGIAAGMDKSEAQDERIEALEQKTDEHDIRLFALEHAINT